MVFAMDANLNSYVVLLLCLLVQIMLSFSASEQLGLQSVPDLEKSMYMVMDGYPCVRLLNLSGEIGCANPGLDKVVAPIVRLKDAEKLLQPSTVLVPFDEFDRLFLRLSSDSNFARNVAGVLIESVPHVRNQVNASSPDKKFPQDSFAPYRNNNFEWNPTGSGILWKPYDFPVFLLSKSSTLIFKELDARNGKRKEAATADVTEFDVVMQTTKAGTRDSESCLREGTCLPLGGYSVWSALPPIHVSSGMHKPIILTMASMDAASFFRDKSLGADSPLSGLISLLAAVDALSHVEGLNDLTKQLVFVVFTGEAWGYLGSRRFLLELDEHSNAVDGINSTLIETLPIAKQVMEIGSVGKGFDQGVKTIYAHTTELSPTTNETLKALQRAQDSFGSGSIRFSTASASNPGVPPSSLMSFLRKQDSPTSGVVLEDFDTAFTNKFYHSHLDDMSNINSSAITAAASLIARTLYILASDTKDLSDSHLSGINVNTSLVEELLGCLLNCEPGLSCGLVKRYITPSTTCPSHYVGVVLGKPSSPPYAGYVGDVPRFIWSFLADKTSVPTNITTACSKNCSKANEMCIKEEVDGKGVCITSMTRYVPAYSTRLKYESGAWKVLPPNSSDPMGAVDPVWAESNWGSISVRVYTVQSATYDRLVLLAGIVVTVLSYIAMVIVRAFITKALKRD